MPKSNETKQQMSLEFIQNLFEMDDTNKWLKLRATSEEQIKRIQKIEDYSQKLKETLYVPKYQPQNI